VVNWDEYLFIMQDWWKAWREGIHIEVIIDIVIRVRNYHWVCIFGCLEVLGIGQAIDRDHGLFRRGWTLFMRD
jgi:hypothetical protein